MSVTEIPIGGGIKETVEVTFHRLWLLGVWQGSWERVGVVDRVTQRNASGIGVVTPAEQLQALLDQDDVKEGRDAYFADRRFEEAAKLDDTTGV